MNETLSVTRPDHLIIYHHRMNAITLREDTALIGHVRRPKSIPNTRTSSHDVVIGDPFGPITFLMITRSHPTVPTRGIQILERVAS
jgi:hypothetical protein